MDDFPRIASGDQTNLLALKAFFSSLPEESPDDTCPLMKYLILIVLLSRGLSAVPEFEKISQKNGCLVYAGGTEVNLFGVNFQPMLSFEHGARMHNQGVLMPLKIRDIKEAADRSFDEIQLLGAEIIRIHLHPADFTDSEGNLIETIWLDALDYTIDQAQRRGLYLYITLLNHLDHDGTQFPYNREAFAAKYAREDWMYENAAMMATENYIVQLLNRRNPYNRQLYKEHAALAVLEPVNEPAYVWYEKWLEKHPGTSREAFEQWSYENTLRYLNRMVQLLRSEGVRQPIIWNCGWARLIQKNRSTFRAIADSDVDGISFCLYPGQDDLKAPFWENPEDLSDRNYLPYLESCLKNEDWLGWLRSDEFQDKAKLVYEYETFCNQSAYMYPAMAAFYRSLDVQIAAQWTYGLAAYAEYLGGSHVFNLQTTPRKAASFMVAKSQFKDVPTTYSYASRSSAVYHEGTLLYSGFPENMEWANAVLGNEPAVPKKIIGVGNSPYVRYEGNGLFFIEPSENEALRLTLMPNVEFLHPHWKERHTGDLVVRLDRTTAHPFELRRILPEGPRWLYRRQGWRWVLVQKLEDAISFQAQPGEYLIEKAPLQIHRKLLEEGWGN